MNDKATTPAAAGSGTETSGVPDRRAQVSAYVQRFGILIALVLTEFVALFLVGGAEEHRAQIRIVDLALRQRRTCQRQPA